MRIHNADTNEGQRLANSGAVFVEQSSGNDRAETKTSVSEKL
jgi:hypothetical protein